METLAILATATVDEEVTAIAADLASPATVVLLNRREEATGLAVGAAADDLLVAVGDAAGSLHVLSFRSGDEAAGS